jgi:branched-subunit amino acid aminotransferase/4-amino-4-deoxychorismate lyase
MKTDFSSVFVSVNGELHRSREAKIPAVSSGLFYGVGCFETMRYESSGIFRFQEHVDRLNRGLGYLEVPESKFLSAKILFREITDLIQKNGLKDKTVRVRVQVSLLENKGYQKDEGLVLARIITCKEILDTKPVSCKLVTCGVRVVPGDCRPANLKLSNMLHYRKAYRKAKQAGADDALMLTINGHLAESSIANLFWKKGNIIYTPSADCDILPGIMRNCVIEIIKNTDGLILKEGDFFPSKLENTECIWLTNSVQEIKPVEEIDGRTYPVDHQFLELLSDALDVLKKSE